MTTAELKPATASPATLSTTMKALVYHGPGKRAWEDKPRPAIQDPGDAIVRITTSTICGTDLHILKGDLPAVTDGRILGHEGHWCGRASRNGRLGVSRRRQGHHLVRHRLPEVRLLQTRHVFPLPATADGFWATPSTELRPSTCASRKPMEVSTISRQAPTKKRMVMLSDILPTGFECGVLNGQVKPGDTVAIVGAGPVGLAVLLTAQFYSPAAIFMIDLDDKRLAVAKQFGATTLINSADGQAAHHVMELTEGAGVDVAIEAVGLPATFAICQAIVAAGGRIANVGVHGKPVELHMEKLWDRNISLTTRLVDTVTTPMLLKVVRSGKLQPSKLVTHRFAMNDIMKAYDTFGNAAKEGALKVVLTNA